jgi:lipid-A-disaccharide synthase-like uncharacterized protein|tara:strand:- start:2164 stop:2448 length:285 start_codon:yes stop_codon:yes gene_type:complete
MNTDDNIAFIAITIGLAQMMMLTNKLINTKDISYYSLEYVLAGILASTLWIIYQYRKGANFSVMYSTAGLFLGLYILKRLLKERKSKKEKSPSI